MARGQTAKSPQSLGAPRGLGRVGLAAGGARAGRWTPPGVGGRTRSGSREPQKAAPARVLPHGWRTAPQPSRTHAPSPPPPRRAPVGRGQRRGPPGLRESQRSVLERAELQHQVPHAQAVRGGQGDQLQLDIGPGGQGRVPQRHGGPQTEVAL